MSKKPGISTLCCCAMKLLRYGPKNGEKPGLLDVTPPGVGMGQKPAAVYLKPGDVMTMCIDKLGTQRQAVVAWRR